MKATVWLGMTLITLVSYAAGQLALGPAASAPRYDTGTIANGVYTNECMGFSIAIPPGWDLHKEQGGSDTTKVGTHFPDGRINLLNFDRHGDPPMANRIVMIAQDGTRFNGNPRDLVTRAVHGAVDADPVRYELLREAFPVSYGGKQFYRADYKQNLRNGGEMYQSYVFTSFRGYLLGEILMTRSAAALNDAADSLQHISFTTDQSNPACIVGDNTQTGRMVGVIGTVASGGGGKPLHVLVSSKVAAGLLVKKVDPQYPDEARKAGIQGPVTLKITISKNGDVEPNITVISGDPKLIAAAVEAVRNWKFKPYTLNSEPVEIETNLAVAFEPLP